MSITRVLVRGRDGGNRQGGLRHGQWQKGMIENIFTKAPFKDKILQVQSEPLTGDDVAILQVNLGYRCNMACRHCHVEAGRDRDEMMDGETVRSVLSVLKDNGIKTVDITGGAPEMNPYFMHLVEEAKKAGSHLMVRTNLTVLIEEGMEHLPEFMSDHSIEVIASLPYFTENDVDLVRGKGTFGKCVRILQRFNGLGYGKGLTDKTLNLVYNPAGAFLCPPQGALEDDYRRELNRRFGISFDSLYTFNNMPIGRFRDFLLRTNNMDKYMEELICSFNPETMPGLMCRHIISVGWDGRLYDCDFNQMLGLTVTGDCPRNIRDFDLSRIVGRTITVGDHCYACAASQGST